MLLEVAAIAIAAVALAWTFYQHFDRRAGEKRTAAAVEMANEHALRSAKAAERSAEAAERVVQASADRSTEANRDRAFEEILWPLLESLRDATHPSRFAGSGTAGAASTRFRSIKEAWTEMGRLLRHPLHVHLDESVLASVNEWRNAENDLESIWVEGAYQGSILDRVSFALLVEDSSRRIDRVTDEEIDRAVQATFLAPADNVVNSARELTRDDEERFERKRQKAEEWHEARKLANRTRTAASTALDEAIKRGPRQAGGEDS